MRLSQCRILQSLHAQMQKIRAMPKQAHLISGYILYLTEYIVEMNIPQKQLDRLHQISRDMEREPMPQTREEFEGRAILYHILMDLEEFLHAKQRFVATMDPAVKKIYWGNSVSYTHLDVYKRQNTPSPSSGRKAVSVVNPLIFPPCSHILCPR